MYYQLIKDTSILLYRQQRSNHLIWTCHNMPSSDNYTIVFKHCKTGIIKTAEKIKKEIKNSFAALSKQLVP